jgi:exoribonuclease II
MRSPGCEGPLYILPFDHRYSFQTKLFGRRGPLLPRQIAEIAAARRVICDAFRAAVVCRNVPGEKAAILVDEQFVADILRDARKDGYKTVCPAEKFSRSEYLEQISSWLGRTSAFCADVPSKNGGTER